VTFPAVRETTSRTQGDGAGVELNVLVPTRRFFLIIQCAFDGKILYARSLYFLEKANSKRWLSNMGWSWLLNSVLQTRSSSTILMLPSIRANCSVWDNTRSGLRTRRLPRSRVRRIPSVGRPTAGRAGWCRSWWHVPRPFLAAAAVGPVLVLPTRHPPRPRTRQPPNSNRSFANNCAINQPGGGAARKKEGKESNRERLSSHS
jgi:hypothetical protein